MHTPPETAPPSPAAPAAALALSPRKAWLVGGGLALVAATSLATALALRGPGMAPAASAPADAPAGESRETIVSTKSPTPRAAAAAPAAPQAAAPTQAATTATARCADCGTVQAVTAIERKGEATGLGAVGGAVAGGLLGSQMGGGSGQDAMTVIGAVGGGVAGHHMERKLRSSTEYRVRVKMADGTTRTLSHPTRVAVGEAVRVDGERLVVAARGASPASPPAARTAQAEPREARPAAAAEDRPRSLADAKRL